MARDLPQLREKIDQIDAAIVALLAQRMEVCREVAEVKAGSSTAVIQPERVREVLTTRRQWAINSGVDADFAEQIFRTLLAETHRIEVAHERGGVAPTKVADTLLSALDTVAVRIDHVVVAVENAWLYVGTNRGRRHRHRNCWWRNRGVGWPRKRPCCPRALGSKRFWRATHCHRSVERWVCSAGTCRSRRAPAYGCCCRRGWSRTVVYGG